MHPCADMDNDTVVLLSAVSRMPSFFAASLLATPVLSILLLTGHCKAVGLP